MRNTVSLQDSHVPKPKRRRKRSALPSVSTPSPFRILNEPVAVEDDGAAGEVSLAEALLFKDYERATSGDARALKRMVKKLIKRDMARPKPRRRLAKAGRIPIEQGDPQNARAALELLGIIAEEPSRGSSDPPIGFFLIEPWAVDASLNRNRFSTLDNRVLNFIKAWTREPESVSWPELREEDADGKQ